MRKVKLYDLKGFTLIRRPKFNGALFLGVTMRDNK